MITLVARFTMKPGKVSGALKLVAAVKAEADASQPGTLFYLVHRTLDAAKKPTRELLFYECYRDQAALDAHLASRSWQALTRQWRTYFEKTPKDVEVTAVERIAGFVHLDAP